jgi:hypothetical protein
LCSYQPIIITGGTLTLANDSEIYADLFLIDGILTVNGALQIYGALIQYGGAIGGGGTITANQTIDSSSLSEAIESTGVFDTSTNPTLDLPVMQLVNDDLSLLHGQVFYLDYVRWACARQKY